MREIKFRGKHQNTGEWLYGALCISSVHDPNICWVDEELVIIETPVICPDTIGQCTGLTDYNGKEIYEDDVMMYKNNIGVVTYYKGRGRFQLKVKGQPPLTLHNMRGAILGNIHDNPNLINK